jgi:hypothetical protein
MPVTRQQAIIRLIGAWCERVIEDESYGLRVTLADALSLDAIEAVVQGDLLAEFDPEVRIVTLAQNDREIRRQQELVRQWLAPRMAAVQ